MGLFGAIGGAIGGFFSGIGGALSGALGGLSSVLGMAGGFFGVVCMAIKGIATLLGIGKEEEKPEELGLKAEKSDKKPEDFGNFEEYKDYIDAIELDEKDFSKLEDPEKKQAYTALGTAVYLQGLEEHYDMKINPANFVVLNSLGIKSPEDTKKFLDKCKEENINPELDKLQEGKLSETVETKMIDTLKSSVANMENKEEISNRLDQMLSEM